MERKSATRNTLWFEREKAYEMAENGHPTRPKDIKAFNAGKRIENVVKARFCNTWLRKWC